LGVGQSQGWVTQVFQLPDGDLIALGPAADLGAALDGEVSAAPVDGPREVELQVPLAVDMA
jgi:hypothetical protein